MIIEKAIVLKVVFRIFIHRKTPKTNQNHDETDLKITIQSINGSPAISKET